MNQEQIDLLKKVLDQVDREPESLYMGNFETLCNYDRFDWRNDDESIPGCGTTRCVAGWTVHFLSRPHESSYEARKRLAHELGIASRSTGDIAQAALGLTFVEADRVFYLMDEREAVAWLRHQVAQPADTA